jgi:DNA gyrase subunit A
MQTTFGIIFLAIVNNQPQIMNLPTMLRHFVEHRKEIVVRRTRYELRKAEERAHILEGLVKALDHLDEVIRLIRSSSTPAIAKSDLVSTFDFSELQAQAILDMRLQRLTGLERDKILAEYQEILALITRLKEILASEKLVLDIISGELRQIKEQYGDARRTEIIAETREISIEDMIAEEDMVITVSRGGYIKRSPLTMYRAQKRGGKGKIGMQTKEEDIVEHLFVASTHAYILVFTDRGRLYWLKVHTIPEVASAARGKAIVNLIAVEPGESVRALLTVKDFDAAKYVVMVTRGGRIKKTELTAFSNVRTTGIIAIDINEGDDLHSVELSNGNCEIFVGTHDGFAIRFHESDIRPMGRGAAGVKAISLRGDDHVVEMDILPESPEGRIRAERRALLAGDDETDVTEIADLEPADETPVDELAVDDAAELNGDDVLVDPPAGIGQILTVTEKGFGKRTPIPAYRLQTRGGMGITNIKTTDKNGKVAGIKYVTEDEQVLLITEQGKIIRVTCSSIRTVGRSTQGVKLIHVDEDDKVVAAVKIVDREEPEGEELPEGEGLENAETPSETSDESAEPSEESPAPELEDDDTIH